MAVAVVVVGGAIGGADGEERDRCADKIDAGVGGFREHSERTGEQASHELEQSDAGRSEHG